MKRVNQFKILLTDAELAQIKAYSEAMGVSMSDAARSAILSQCVPGTVHVKDSVQQLDVSLEPWYLDLCKDIGVVSSNYNVDIRKLRESIAQLQADVNNIQTKFIGG